MLPDEDKTKEQLIDELARLRQRFSQLAAAEIKRKRAEDVLRQYEMAIDGSVDLIAAVDWQYRYLFSNEAFLIYHGMTSNQVVGHAVAELLGEDVFKTTVKPNVDRCLQGELVKYEMKHRYPKLGERYLEVLYYPLTSRLIIEWTHWA